MCRTIAASVNHANSKPLLNANFRVSSPVAGTIIAVRMLTKRKTTAKTFQQLIYFVDNLLCVCQKFYIKF